MKCREFLHGLDLMTPTEGYKRTPGLHISEVYNDLYRKLDPKRYDKRDKDGKPLPLPEDRVGFGTRFEEALEPQLAAKWKGARPGEFAVQHESDCLHSHIARRCDPARARVRVGDPLCSCGAGIIYSPDYIFYVGGEDILGEFKLTWYSSRGFPNDPKFDKWKCVAPATRILTSDLRYVEAGNVTPGMRLLAFDEYPTTTPKRRLRHSTVQAVSFLKKPCYRVILKNGTEVVCSDDHLWYGWYNTKAIAAQWFPTTRLLRQDRAEDYGRPRVSNSWMCQVVPPSWGLDGLTDYEHGYLAGVFDGEGSLTVSNKFGGLRLSFAQNPGEVLDRVKHLLDVSGLEYRDVLATGSGSFGDKCRALYVTNKHDMFKFLGSVRSIRLLKKFESVVALPSLSGSERVEVAAREYVGEREVVAIQTDTGTYIAEGLASHNCQIKFYLRNLRMQKVWVFPFWVNGGTDHAYREVQPEFKRAYELVFPPKETEAEHRMLIRHARKMGVLPNG